MKHTTLRKLPVLAILAVPLFACVEHEELRGMGGIDDESPDQAAPDEDIEPGSGLDPVPADPAGPPPEIWVDGDRLMMRTPVPDSIGDLVSGAQEYLVALDLNDGHAIVNVLDQTATPVFLVSFEPLSNTFEDAPYSARALFSREAVAGCVDLPCLPDSTLAGPEADHLELGSWATILAVSGSIDGVAFETTISLDADGVPSTMDPSGGPLDLPHQDRLNILGEVLLDVSQYADHLSAAGDDAVPTGGSWGCEFGRYTTLAGLGVLWGACCVATAETAGAGCVLCSAGAKAAGDAVLDYDCGG